MNSVCIYCLDDNDLSVAFADHKICMKCVRKQYRLAVKGKPKLQPKVVSK